MPRENFYTRDLIKNTNYIIGEHTYGNPKIYDWQDGGKLIIGKYSSIADGVTILLGGNHQTKWVSTYPFPALISQWPKAKDIQNYRYSKGDVVIGNDVWIGNGVTILSGVKVGDGVVIGAGALVTKSIEPYTIVVGNPAKPIKKRFSRRDIKKLLLIKWWEWDEKIINDYVDIICSSDVKALSKIKHV